MYCPWLKTFHGTFEKLGIKRTLWVSTISHFFSYAQYTSATLDNQSTKFMYVLPGFIVYRSNVLCMCLPSTLNVIGPKGGEGEEKSKCFYKMMI